MTTEQIWLVVGFMGQGLFGARFFVQWLRSEKERKSVIPLAFWYLSIGGGLVLLSYAIYKMDPVFITGQAMGLLIYSRNLYFIHRERNAAADETKEREGLGLP
jgi:lipid-A-disaccharide synthase-like uncharacterized protein